MLFIRMLVDSGDWSGGPSTCVAPSPQDVGLQSEGGRWWDGISIAPRVEARVRSASQDDKVVDKHGRLRDCYEGTVFLIPGVDPLEGAEQLHRYQKKYEHVKQVSTSLFYSWCCGYTNSGIIELAHDTL